MDVMELRGLFYYGTMARTVPGKDVSVNGTAMYCIVRALYDVPRRPPIKAGATQQLASSDPPSPHLRTDHLHYFPPSKLPFISLLIFLSSTSIRIETDFIDSLPDVIFHLLLSTTSAHYLNNVYSLHPSGWCGRHRRQCHAGRPRNGTEGGSR